MPGTFSSSTKSIGRIPSPSNPPQRRYRSMLRVKAAPAGRPPAATVERFSPRRAPPTCRVYRHTVTSRRESIPIGSTPIGARASSRRARNYGCRFEATPASPRLGGPVSKGPLTRRGNREAAPHLLLTIGSDIAQLRAGIRTWLREATKSALPYGAGKNHALILEQLQKGKYSERFLHRPFRQDQGFGRRPTCSPVLDEILRAPISACHTMLDGPRGRLNGLAQS